MITHRRLSRKLAIQHYPTCSVVVDLGKRRIYRFNKAAGRYLRCLQDNAAREIHASQFADQLCELGLLVRPTPQPETRDRTISDFPTGGRNQIREELRTYAEEHHIPLSATLELTYACNLRCPHCFVNSPKITREGSPASQELSTAEWTRVIDELAALGCLFVTLTGGEVFARKDACDLIARTRQRWMAVMLYSNAWAIDVARAAWLADIGIDSVQLSIHGATAGVHDRFVGKKGSFRRVLDATKEIKKYGVRVVWAMPVTTQNVNDVPEVRRLAEDYGVQHQPDVRMIPRRDEDNSPRDRFQISQEQASEILKDMLPTPVRGNMANRAADEAICACALRTLAVDPYGNVYPCMDVREIAGNAKNATVESIWHTSPVIRRYGLIKFRNLLECNSCNYTEVCSRCHGRALADAGSPTGPSPLDCENARIIKRALDPVTV